MAAEKWREAATVLTDSFGSRGDDEVRSTTEKHGGGAWSSVSRCLRSGRAKLGWGMSAVRHGEGLGTFYGASDGVERAEGRTIGGGSVELQWRSRFRWGRKWGGVTGSRGDERGISTDSFFAMGGEGVLHGEGEQVEVVLGREAAGWPSAGGRRKVVAPRLGQKAAHAGRLDGSVRGFQARRGRRVLWAEMGQEAREAWAGMGISTENSNSATKANGLLSAKTHRWVSTGNMRAGRPGASIYQLYSSHAP
jgi:hypothetical protein